MIELPKCVSDESGDFIPQPPKAKSKHVVHLKRPKIEQEQKPRIKKIPKKLYGDHMKEWREHRQRVLHITGEVDNKPPGFQAARATGVHTLRENAVCYMERTKKNIQMLVELSKTKRTHGVINPFRYERVYTMSALPIALKNLDRIEEENLDIAKRILQVVAEIDTGIKSNKGFIFNRKSFTDLPFQINEGSLDKYKGFNFHMPETNKERWQLFRPRIYFDMYLKDARPLGRVVIQLYTEAAPVVVLEIVRACMSNKFDKFVIKRLFPSLWIDVKLSLDSNSPLLRPLEYDAKIIDHGAYGHVLSFSKEHLQGFRDHLSFALSFKPLRVVNGSRVGFGRVIKGSKIIDCLQSYGTKNGKLFRSIIFTGCGFL
ncbi:uncharacterized protein LOC132791006 [Drosophila nasuta]|uniref:uncharacterized protein LOC132791006 n=1 Tax=Drosophila nasuta TaxID=42062 RepID=UPI00295E7478|nr:uncharacterized protein LOC132791006 [Drosophila nasuta]